MSRYIMDDGTFEELDPEFHDGTVHVLQLEGGLRLLVDREALRGPVTARAAAEARTTLHGRAFTKFAQLTARDGDLAGCSTREVTGMFRDGDDLVVERRAHFVLGAAAFTLTTRGPLAARARVDDFAERLLGGVYLRGGEDAPPRGSVYATNDLALELPGPYVDHTVHDFTGPLPRGQSLALLVTRDAMGKETSLEAAARAHTRDVGRTLAFHRVTEVRARDVAGAAAVEVLSAWAHSGVEQHAHDVHVAAAGTRLSFSATAPSEHRAACEAAMERVVSTLELRTA